MQLIGEFQISLDAKGRFLMPSGIKKQLPDDDIIDIVVNRGFEKCLVVYPRKTWESVQNKLNSLNDFNPKAREFKRLFLNGASVVELDKVGRALLPKSLIDYAELTKDIMLIGLGNKMEIWSKAQYETYMNSNMSGFSDLATEVAGGDFFSID